MYRFYFEYKLVNIIGNYDGIHQRILYQSTRAPPPTDDTGAACVLLLQSPDKDNQ